MRESPPAISTVPLAVPVSRALLEWAGVPLRWALCLLVLVTAACGSDRDRSHHRGEASADTPDVLAQWSGGQVTLQELDQQIGEELRELEIRYLLTRYERMARLMDDLIDRSLLEEEARRRGLPSPEALLVLEVEEKTPRPTPEQVEATYPALVAQVGHEVPDRIGSMLQNELWHRAQEARYREFVGELRDRAGVEVALPYPDLPRVDVPIAPHNPQLGPENAPVTLIEFADHTCQWCAESADTVARIRARWPDQVRVVWKDFPLPTSRRALPAAVAAHCARDQGAFWEMRERLLAGAHALGDRDLVAHARALDLDADQFEECMVSGRHIRGIHADLATAQRVGVRGAPTFLVNGILVPGIQPWDRLAGVIERELDRAAR